MNLSRGEMVGAVIAVYGLLSWMIWLPGYAEARVLGLFALIYLGYRALKRYMAAGD